MRNSGFTLIELVVVLAVLAALAGLVLPRVDFVRTQAALATNAAGIEETMSNLQLYKTVKGTYPGGFDSLLDTTGAGYNKMFTHGGALPAWMEIGTLTATQYSALVHNFVSDSTGNVNVYDHSTTSVDYSNSGATKRAIATGGLVAKIKEVNLTHVDDDANPATPSDDDDGVAGTDTPNSTPTTIIGALYPDGVPAEVDLFAFGVGAKNSAVNVTMVAPPLSAGSGSVSPATHYCRYIAVFAVKGSKAELKAVIDPLGSNINARLTSYYTSSPE